MLLSLSWEPVGRFTNLCFTPPRRFGCGTKSKYLTLFFLLSSVQTIDYRNSIIGTLLVLNERFQDFAPYVFQIFYYFKIA